MGSSYFRSDDPVVVSVVEGNTQARLDWIMAASRFAEKYGGIGYRYSGFAGGFKLTAITTEGNEQPDQTLHGRWKRYKGGGWVPMAGNPAHAEMQAVQVEEVKVPGLPGLVTVDDPRGDGRIYWYTPRPFSHEGVCWVEIEGSRKGQIKDFSSGMGIDSALWGEVKASEFHAAKEAREEWAEAQQKASG